MDENSGHVAVILLALVLTFGLTIMTAKIKNRKK